jgi:uncharacterized protein (TIGR03435 family)
MRNAAGLLLTVLWSGVPLGQSADSPVAFEVASVKASPPPGGRGMRVGCNGGPGSKDPGTITCTNMNLANLVTMAYGIAHYLLSGLSPGDSERFEIAAKLPAGATKDQVELMWQNLLAERFKLAVHRENKEISGYELVVAKGGLKVKESAPPPPAPAATDDAAPPAPPRPAGPPKFQLDKDGFPDLPAGRGASMIMMNGKARWRASDETMEQLAAMLGVQLDQPVKDATGLQGKYDFTLSWANESFGGGRGALAGPDGGAPAAGLAEPDNGPTLLQAIQSQLGVKLEQKKTPVEILVVDHVEKVPTEN